MLCDSYISDLQKMHTYNLCDSCMGAMRLMHTDSSVVRLSDSLSSVNQIHESSKYSLRIVVFQQHYTDSPVNYPFVPLTYLLYTRIINFRKSISTIESSITNESSPRLSKVILGKTFVSVAKKSHPVTPLQWKYGTPSSGNMS